MSFSFDFSGDDVYEPCGDTVGDVIHSQQRPALGASALGSQSRRPRPPRNEISSHQVESEGRRPDMANVRKHSIEDMLNSLPSRISYTTTLVTSPQRERKSIIPRRALFDVRMQIMAESDTLPTSTLATPNSGSSSPTSAFSNEPSSHNKWHQSNPNGSRNRVVKEGHEIGLGDTDIERNVYEGGFKSWEGALDLARLVLERGPRKDLDELARVNAVVELGCGTALPTLVLFQHALATDLSLYFTLADYNESVLRLVTMPNLLLVWALQHSPGSFSPSAPVLSAHDESFIEYSDGDLDVTPELVQHFISSLAERSLDLRLLSGPWSPQLLKHLPLHADMSLLCLAAETIYSPSSLNAFTETLLGILKSVRMGKAIVAAKRVYFGVGGSVDEFKVRVSEGGGVAYEVENSGVEGTERGFMGGPNGSGVGRCLLEVQMC